MIEKVLFLVLYPFLLGISIYGLIILFLPFIKDFIYKSKYSKNILNKTKNLMKKLDLPIIPIEFGYDNYNACFKRTPLKIIFGLTYLRYKNTQQTDYTICHEVGHYFQYHKFPKWFDKVFKAEMGIRVISINSKEYKSLKLEKNADKLAKIFQKFEYSIL